MYNQLLFTHCFAWHHPASVLPIEAQSSPRSIKVIFTNNKTRILPWTSKLIIFSIILFKQPFVCSEQSCNYKKVTGYSIILIPIQDIIVSFCHRLSNHELLTMKPDKLTCYCYSKRTLPESHYLETTRR